MLESLKIRRLSYQRRQALFAVLVCTIGVGFMWVGSLIVGLDIAEKAVYVTGYVVGMIAICLMFEIAEFLQVP